jgi:hypothetical protein
LARIEAEKLDRIIALLERNQAGAFTPVGAPPRSPAP